MLEIPALLRRRSKHNGKLLLHKSLINRQKRQGWWSSSMDWVPWCLHPHLCASVWVLLQGSSGWQGNKGKYTLCIFCGFVVVPASCLWPLKTPDRFGFPNSHPYTLGLWLCFFWVTCPCFHLLYASFLCLSSVIILLFICAGPPATFAAFPPHWNGPFLSS